MREKTARFELRLPQNERDNLVRICAVLNIPKGQFVREAIRRHVSSNIVKLLVSEADGLQSVPDIMPGEECEDVSAQEPSSEQAEVLHAYRIR
jgi:hypothetical protein